MQRTPSSGLRRILAVACVAGCGMGDDAALSGRDLAEQLTLGPDWLELEPKPPIVVRRAGQELVLHHSPELTLTRAVGSASNVVYCPKLGQLIWLDIEVVGHDGSVETFASGGISPGRLGMRRLHADFPSPFEAEKLRLRSSQPLNISKLEWREATSSLAER